MIGSIYQIGSEDGLIVVRVPRLDPPRKNAPSLREVGTVSVCLTAIQQVLGTALRLRSGSKEDLHSVSFPL